MANALLALLFAVGFVVKFSFIIGAFIGLVVGAHSTRLAMDSHFARVEAERRGRPGWWPKLTGNTIG